RRRLRRAGPVVRPAPAPDDADPAPPPQTRPPTQVTRAAPDPADVDIDDLRPQGEDQATDGSPAVRPGSAAPPGGWRAPLNSRNPSQFKATGLADAGAQGRFSPFESGRQGSGHGTTECSFRRGSFDRPSDLDWRT